MLTVIVELLIFLQKEKKKTNHIKFNFCLENVTPVHSIIYDQASCGNEETVLTDG